jgi:WD40 repeat protein
MRNSIAALAAIILIAVSAWLFFSHRRGSSSDHTPSQAVLVLEHPDMVVSVAFSPDGYRVLTAAGNDAHLWDAETGRHLAVLGPHDGWVTSAEFSPDGRHAATASADGTARLWEVAAGRPAWPWFLRRETAKASVTFVGHEAPVWSATFTRNGQRVVTKSADGTVRAWNAATGEATYRVEVASLAFSSDGRRAVVVLPACSGAYVETATVKERVKLESHDKRCMGTATFSPDGRRIAIELSDEAVELWEADAGKSLAVLAGDESLLLATAFSPDSRRFAAAFFDRTARLWDGHTGKPLATLAGHERSVGSVAFSPDSRRIVTASFDQTARLWDGETGQPLATLSGHTHEVRRAVFSPDGRLVATASSDRTSRLWRLAP